MNLDYLMSQLYHEALMLRTTFIYNLRGRRNRKFVKYLIPLLKDQEEMVRRAVAKVLGDLGDKQVVVFLIDLLLVETEFNVKEMVYKSLGKLKDLRAIPTLVAGLKEHPDGLYAAHALAGFGGQVYDELITVLTTADNISKANAASALKLLGDKRAGAFLLQQLNTDDDELKISIFLALSELKEPLAVPVFVNAMTTEENWRVRL